MVIMEVSPRRKAPLIIGIVVTLVIVCFGVFGGYYYYFYYGPCGVQRVNAVLPKFQQVWKKYDDAEISYFVGGSDDMPDLIGEMQSVKREVELIEVPACMNKLKALLLKGIQGNIEHFSIYASQKDDKVIAASARNAGQQMHLVVDELDAVLSCIPFCSQEHYNVNP
jgi:hypothetical protein